ncbi:peptidase U32 family protein [Endomicrobium proavitum]|uniref:Putative U32 family peptidase n=1 Tax=Endomicrobium proavitum TaxID=1408281 RepID=A0A0G3WH16_9BACT|nr:peptidase U32 family protein [Endomicrobium proavitum]AKL97618.1 putative U32 family peptidase [Endomicrobium proavitum]
MNNLEILAPAGSKETFIAAVAAQADAIYLGLENFSARSKAQNFTRSQFYDCVNFARKNNVKVYVALNTLIKQKELSDAIKQINFIASCGADAVIAQDLGVANIVKQYFPQLKLHASTQAAIHNSYGVLEAQKAGFKRIVLARELSFQEIKSISSKTNAELEVFVHGALCFSVSGVCLMSSFIGGASGNRGMCAQPCRRRYDIGAKSGFYMSPKDLNLSAHIRELKQSGVSSLKIEGRMKSPQYVYKTVKAYKMLASDDGIQTANQARALLEQDFARAKTTFNFIKKSDDIFAPQTSKQIGAYIGKISFQNGKIQVKTDVQINSGDTLKAADSKNDKYFKVNILNLNKTGNAYEIETNSADLKTGMELFKTLDGKFEEKLKKITSEAIIEKQNFEIKEKEIPKPKHAKAKSEEKLFVKIDDLNWLNILQPSGNTNAIFSLAKQNLSKIDALKNINYFELPAFIDEADLPQFQAAIDKLKNKTFFLNNIGHFRFFKNSPAAAKLNAGAFLYSLNSFAANFLFKRKIENFVFSYEDDFYNISDLAKENLADKGIFYLSGFPQLAVSKMTPHKDLRQEENFSSQKDNFKVINKNGQTIILPQYPVMLFNKLSKLKKLGIRKFIIDLSYIKPNKTYFETMLGAYSGKIQLQNDFEFNFERKLK